MNPPRTLIKMSEIPSRIDQIKIEAGKTPGPGRYEAKKKRKVLGNYLYKAEGGTMTDDAIVHGMSTPSHYDSIDLNKIKNQVQYVKYTKPTREIASLNRISKIEKDGSPGAGTYNENDAFYKTAIDSPIKWPLNKATRKTYTH